MNDITQKTGPCPVCNEDKELKKYQDIVICMECAKLAETLDAEKQRVKRLKNLLTPVSREPLDDLPEVLDARRYRTRDRENNSWYVSVSEMEGEPVEIFASTAFDRDQHLQSRISNLTTITRLISLILRHISVGEKLTLNKTLNQLRRSSRQRNDLPDMLAGVLSSYAHKDSDTAVADYDAP